MTLEEEQRAQKREQQWLIETIIIPQLPQLLETLTLCSDLLTSKTAIKLPITSCRTEHVKGVLTRVGIDVSDLQIVIDLPTLGKKLPLQLQKTVILQQLQRLMDLIEELTEEVIFLQHYAEKKQNADVFQEKLNNILKLLNRCNHVINKPNEEIIFPKHTIKLSENFRSSINLDQYQEKLAIDIFLQNGELSIECRSLHKITHSPWNIVSKGKSHIDKLREDMKQKKTTANQIIEKYTDTSLSLKHALGIHKFTIHDYLFRGVTFGDIVVIETEKSIVHCQDPNILSISTKITWLEHHVSKMYNNLNVTMI